MNIYDIAEKAGVSIATVSRVLNGSDRVSPKTKEKVLQAMEKANYTPNIFARGLCLGSIKMVGILCTDFSDMYYAKSVSVIENLLRNDGYDVLLYCTGDLKEEKIKCLNRLIEKKVDGIITIGSAFKENLPDEDIAPISAKTPFIMLNSHCDVPGVYSVKCDEGMATYQCVEKLYSSNFKNILYLYDKENDSGKSKIAGFKEGISTFGITRDSFTLKAPREVLAAKEIAFAMLNNHTEIEAVITSEDILAVGVLQALEKLGKKMPVIGFNDSILALCTLPTLTSVDNMAVQLSTAVVNTMTAIFKGENVSDKIVFSPKIVYRDSFNPENFL